MSAKLARIWCVPREQLDLDEGETVARFQRFVERDGAASVRHGMVIDAHGVRFAVLAQEAFDAGLRRLGAAEADAEVEIWTARVRGSFSFRTRSARRSSLR